MALAVGGLAVATGPGLFGANTAWTPPAGSVGNQSWFTPGNWTAVLPTGGDAVTIANASVAFVEGATAANAASLSILAGGLTVGDFNAGTLNVGGQLAVTGGRLNLNFGTVSVNTLAVGTSGTFADTRSGTLNLTGTNPTVTMALVNVVVNSQITGTNGLIASGPGNLVLGNLNTYSGGTTVSNGTTVQVGNGGTTGSLGAGNVGNAGTLVFGRADAVVVPNLISGVGSVRQAGQGTTTLTADNTFSGGTTISGGTLQVGNGGTAGALGTGSVINAATLAFNRSDDVVLGNVISGAGVVAQTGTGKLTLLSNNTYSGGTAIVSGSLQVGNGGTVGSLGTGSILNNGALAFNRGDAVVISSQIAGTGGLTQAGTGTLTLTGNNTYTGGTIINTGILQVGSGGTSGSLGIGNVTNLGSLVFVRSDSVLVPNVILGTGSVQQTGSGTTVLTGSNTYTGTTTISSGTLQIGNAGATGSLGAGNVVVGGTLIFNRTDTALLANDISGTGTLQQSGAGTLTLTGANTHTGGTLVNAGTLQVGNGGTVGSLGAGITTNNSRLSFNRSDSFRVDNVIAGTGIVNQIGTGTLVLTADNIYSGTTTITGGTLQVGNGGTAGALGAGNVVNNSALVFNRSDKITLGNVIGGTGSLQQAGSGTLVLASNNTYTGGTVVKSGVLQIGDGGVIGTLGQGTVTNNGRLVFNRSDSLSIDTVIDGTGSVRHAGPATLTLTGNNSFSGGTIVDGGGTLRVINSTSLGTGDLNLANGTVKADAGSLTTRTTVTVRGNYAQSTGTVLELGVSGTGASASDQVKVSGKAALNGTLRLSALGSFRPMHNTKVLVLSADGGVSGRFSTFENNLSHSPLLEPQLKFNANDVTLLWGHLSFQPYAGTGNQTVVASALDSLVTSTAADDIQLIDHLDYDFVANLKAGLRGALEKITPEGLTATFSSAFAVMDIQGGQFLKRADELLADYPAIYSAAWRDRAASTAAFDDYVKNPWSVYVEFPLSSFTVSGDNEARGYDVTTRGVTFGFDRRIRDNFFVGLAANYSGSKGDISDGGSVDTKSTGLNAYAVWSKKGLHLVGMVGGASNTYDTKRQSFGGLATGSSTGTGWTGLVGGGYDFQKGSLRIGTQFTGQYMSAGIDKFTERGSFSPLRIVAQNSAALHSQLGLNLRYRHLVQQWTVLTPFCYLGWRHDFMVDRLSLDAQSASGAGNVFRVYGPKLGAESLIGSVGLSVQWRPVLNTSLSYTKQIGRSGYESNSAQLAARLSF